MKNKLIYFSLILLILSSCKYERPTPQAVLAGLFKKMDEHKSISYSVELIFKSHRHKDPLQKRVMCKIIRDAQDSAFHASVWYSVPIGHYSYGYYYSNPNLYFFNDSLKTITKYTGRETIVKNFNGDTWFLSSRIPFIDDERISRSINDTGSIITLTDDTVGTDKCWKITSGKKGDTQHTGFTQNYWIRKTDTVLRRMLISASFDGKGFSNEWNIDSTVFDETTNEGIRAMLKKKFDTYQTKEYNPEDDKLLANGIKAPDFSGTDFASGKKVSLSDYKGKTVILDFWYVNCEWCRRARPFIDKINKDYSKKGVVVLGINSIDASEAARKTLQAFTDSVKSTYPTILTQASTDQAYHVQGYPTLYLINKKGEIAYSVVGYDKNTADSTLRAEIKKLK